jgi:protease IV
VCSMSNYAASGGYFVAAGCDVIFAEPMTITGSIGIFTGKADRSGLANRLGIAVVSFAHGAHADEDSWFRPYTADERVAVLDRLRYLYSRFVGAVAEGRGLSKTAVDAIGRGHVYTGAQAAPIRLVDKLGGLGDAIDEAKRRMGLQPDTLVELRELPKQRTSWFGFLAKQFGVHEAASPLQLTLLKAVLDELPASLLVAPNAPQARLPFGIGF